MKAGDFTSGWIWLWPLWRDPGSIETCGDHLSRQHPYDRPEEPAQLA